MSNPAQAPVVVQPISWFDAARIYVGSSHERQRARKFAVALAAYFPFNITNDFYMPFVGQMDSVALPVNAAFAVYIAWRLHAIRRGK